MPAIQLRMWQETVSLEEAFTQLLKQGHEQPVLRELAKRLIYQRHFEEYGLDPADDIQSQQVLAAFCRTANLNTPDALDKFLEKTRQTKAELCRTLMYQDCLNRLKQVVVPQERVQEHFLQRKARMDNVFFMLMRIDKSPLAWEIFYRLRDDNQDFAQLAMTYSQGPEASYGGLVGPRPLQELNPELRKVLMTLKPGEISEPFTLDEKQYLIVRVLRMEQAQLVPALESSLRDELFEQWTERQINLAAVTVLQNGAREMEAKT